MPDGAVTVDELAIRVAANAETAASNIDRLTASLSRLATILGPTLTQLSSLGSNLGRVSGGVSKAAAGAAAAVPAVTVPTVSPTHTMYWQGKSAVPAAASAVSTGVTQTSNAALAKTGSLLSNVKQRVSAFTSSLRTMGATGTKATTGLASSFIQLRSWVFFALFGLGLIIKGFQTFVGQASSAIETANLFGVAFGNMTDKALQWVQLASGNLGLDPAQMMKTSATFMDMARSMGITTDRAYQMSKGLTQLVYDYASLRDQPFDVAAQKFQSAFAGQTRAIRAYGLDVTQAALQEEIYREGLSYKVTELNRASKSIILYNALIRNSSRAQGDLARTLSSPANMMRILKDTLLVTARAFGYLFIPVLRLVLPWLIAIAQGALMAAQALGAFFGIKMPSWGELVSSMGGVSVGAADAEDSMGGVADNANKAADAVKRMKDYTLGIDELNILAPETPSSAGGGGAGGAGGLGGVAPGIEPFKPYEWGTVDLLEKIVAPIKKMMGEAAAALGPFIAALGRVWDALKPFIKNVWEGFTEFWQDVLVPLGVWTMNTAGVWVLDRVHGILKWFNDNPGAAKNLGAAIAAFSALKGLDIFLGILGKLWGILSGLFGIKFITGILLFVGTFNNAIGAITAAFMAGGITEGFAAVIAYVGTGGILVTAVSVGLAWLGAQMWFWWRYGRDISFAIWGSIWNFLKGLWGTMVKTSTGTWKAIGDYVKSSVGFVWNTVKSGMGNIGKAVSSTWSGLSKGLSGAWNTIKSVFKSGINDILHLINQGPIAAINKLIGAANNIPGSGFLNVGRIDYIPLLAAGGLPSRGSMFIAGEAGPEVYGSFGGNPNTVMPLENSGFVEAMGAAVFKAVVEGVGSMETGGNGDIYMDGQKVGKIIRDGDRRSGVNSSLVRTVG